MDFHAFFLRLGGHPFHHVAGGNHPLAPVAEGWRAKESGELASPLLVQPPKGVPCHFLRQREAFLQGARVQFKYGPRVENGSTELVPPNLGGLVDHKDGLLQTTFPAFPRQLGRESESCGPCPDDQDIHFQNFSFHRRRITPLRPGQRDWNQLPWISKS